MKIQMKRVYDPAESADGFRILVDRLWPRGISKEKAKVDLWAKEVTPSTGLRKEFHSGADSWQEFAERYRIELFVNPALPEFIKTLQKHEVVTFLFAAKDIEHTHVRVLMAAIEEMTG